MSKKGKRYNVSFTKDELRILVEAVGAYKMPIRSRADSLAKKLGVNHQGKSHKRLCYIQSVGRKLSEANEHEVVRIPEGVSVRKGYTRRQQEKRAAKRIANK